MYYKSGRPVVTIPVTSVIPPHAWAQLLVRVHLAPGKQTGAIHSVTLTYVASHQRYTTEYGMPFTLCRRATPVQLDAPTPNMKTC